MRRLTPRSLVALAVSAALAVTLLASPAAAQKKGGKSFEITNVSYDPTRELYEEYGKKVFPEYYKKKTGNSVTVNTSNGGSGSQARAVVDGLQADVVTLALAGDIETIVQKGLIKPGWQAEFPNNSNPYVSTIVFLVRKGNPKNIKDWPDLAKNGVSVITPNPKTSGGAQWNFLAAWGSVTKNGGTEEQAKDLVSKIYKNVAVMDSGARGSSQTFVDKQIGDVLIAWENEALLTLRDHPDDYEIVYPPQTILAEPSVAIVDAIVDQRGTRKVAEEFLSYLYSPKAQNIIAKNFYRPTDPDVLAKYKKQFPDFKKEFITIDDFGGWYAAKDKFFNQGKIFDEIYQP